MDGQINHIQTSKECNDNKLNPQEIMNFSEPERTSDTLSKEEAGSVVETSVLEEKYKVNTGEVEFFRSCIQKTTASGILQFKRALPYLLKDAITPNNNLVKSLIYSALNLHPLSFLIGHHNFKLPLKNDKLKYPSPLLLTYEDFEQEPIPLLYNNFFQGKKLCDRKGIITTDKHLLEKFKGIVGDMIGQILKRLFGGPPVSLNVKIFETKSTLHRNVEAWSYAPKYLKEASSPSITSLERLKLVTAFAISGLILTCNQLKPFNPLIGETLQAEFSDGTQIFAEHIGHYPTLSRYLVLGKNNDYKLHCYFDLDAETKSFGGEIIISQKGNITVEFPKLGEKIVYRMPLIKLDNCRSEEERNCYVFDFIELYDIKNSMKSFVHFAYNSKKKLEVLGAIVNINCTEQVIGSEREQKSSSILFENILKYVECKDKPKFLAKKKMPTPLCIISGDYSKELYFDSARYWNFQVDAAYYAFPCKDVLPSDTRFREDLIWLYYAHYYSQNKAEYELFMKYAQGWKTEIETIQRKEREIRSEIKKSKQPK